MNEKFLNDGKSYIPREVCGKLYAQGKEYLLVHPEPVVRDSWQSDNEKRFLVTLAEPIAYTENGTPLHSFLRHIVVGGSYLIDYCCPSNAYIWEKFDNYVDLKVLATNPITDDSLQDVDLDVLTDGVLYDR